VAPKRQSECRVLPLGAQSGMTTEGSSWAGHDTSRFSVYECLAAVAPLPFSPLPPMGACTLQVSFSRHYHTGD